MPRLCGQSAKIRSGFRITFQPSFHLGSLLPSINICSLYWPHLLLIDKSVGLVPILLPQRLVVENAAHDRVSLSLAFVSGFKEIRDFSGEAVSSDPRLNAGQNLPATEAISITRNILSGEKIIIVLLVYCDR